MSKCLNCGGELGSNKWACPYCGISVKDATAQRKEQDDYLKERFIQIDEAFGLNVNYVRMSTEKLEEFFEGINKKFEESRKSQKLNMAQIEKIEDHLERVQETLQKKYPLRQETQVIPQKNANEKLSMNVAEQVVFLLDNFTKPLVATAAFQLRSSLERKIKDFYKFRVKEYKDDKEGLSYRTIFSLITGKNKNSQIVEQLCHDRYFLNYFIHASKKNDEIIKHSLKTIQEQKRFLLNVLEEFQKYNLI